MEEQEPIIPSEKVKKKKKKAEDGRMLDPNFDKEKAKLEFFDPRGVQTLFRTLSRNHYNLLKMVDSKASIVLTVNSIIISLLMGVLYIAPESEKESIAFITRSLVQVSIISMIFALLSMLPHRYFGKNYNRSGYRGSLYAGNFARRSLEEFQEDFDRIMYSGKTVYSEMVKDLYFLGKAVDTKQRLLIVAVGIFLVGLAGILIYSLVTGGVTGQ